MKTTNEMQLVPIGKLVPYVNNAHTHSPEQINKLRSSLREFGFINPVIIDRGFGVIAGHGRILAAKEEGIEQVPCVFADHLTDAQKKAYILADNRMAMDAGWDEELLRVEIEALQADDFDLSLTGFDEKELAALFGDDDHVQDDDFDLSAALEKAAFVERGDIWTVGRHRLMCGDATNAENVAALMNGKKANLALTDPPYNVSFKASDGLTIQNDSMKNDEFYTFLYNSFKNMAEHLESGGSAYVFHADTEGLNFRRAFVDAGFHLAGVCIWVKNSLVLGRSDYDWDGLYDKMRRVSCWCCPLQSLAELRVLYRDFPDLWAQLKRWDAMTWRPFRADYSVIQLEQRFDFEDEWLKAGNRLGTKAFYSALRERLVELDGTE